MSFTLSVHFLIGFRNVFFPRTFNRKKRLPDEREEYLQCKEKEIGGGRKKNTSLADQRSARFASRYFSYFTPFLPFSPTYCGTWYQDNASPLSVSFPFTFQELFLKDSPLCAFCTFFTQYVVASPCFIPSPQSVIYTHQSYSNPNSKFWLFDWLNYMRKPVILWYGQMVKKKKKMLACETKVEKGVCLRRLAKFSLHSKRFQSSYCAKVVAKANLKWNGEGEGRRGNPCPQTQWSFPSLPSSSPLITVFALVPIFSTNSRGNACYAD